MDVAVTQTLYAYWNEVRGDRIAPKRFEIEPSRIAGILPDTFILERVDGDTCRFRLAGTRICDTFGTEFKGLNVFEMFGEEDRLTLQRQISVICRQGAVGLFQLRAETATGLSCQFEMSLLPLMHTLDRVDRFVGAIAPLKAYPWLGTHALFGVHIISHALVWPDGRQHAMIDNISRQGPFPLHQREARIVRSDRRQFRVYDGGLSLGDDT